MTECVHTDPSLQNPAGAVGSSSPVLLDISEGVATLTLNRPERLNAYDQEMIDLWADLLAQAIASPEVRVIVLTGAGRAFCSGGHAGGVLERSKQSAEEIKAYFQNHIYRIASLMERTDKPTIAALNGLAYSGGLDMALMCDMRIAAASAKFAETYINTGLIAGAGGTYFLPRLVGTSKALEMFWLGETISAEEALKYGMVNRVVPDAELVDATRKIAVKIAVQPEQAVRYYKRTVHQGLTQALDDHLDLVSSHLTILRASEEHQRRFTALLERMASKAR